MIVYQNKTLLHAITKESMQYNIKFACFPNSKLLMYLKQFLPYILISEKYSNFMMGKFYLAMGMSVAASAVGFMFLFWDF